MISPFTLPNEPLRARFKDCFGRPFMDFWHPATGFDVIALHQALAVPDGVSTIEHIETTYGAHAVALVDEVLANELAA